MEAGVGRRLAQALTELQGAKSSGA